jgi:hypothetical protein
LGQRVVLPGRPQFPIKLLQWLFQRPAAITRLPGKLGTSDLSRAIFKQLDQIIRENLFPSDNAFLAEMEAARQRLPKWGRKQPALILPAEPEPFEADSIEQAPETGDRHQAEPPFSTEHSSRPRLSGEVSARYGRDQAEINGVLMTH